MVSFLGLADPFSSLLHVFAFVLFVFATPTMLEGAGVDAERFRAVRRYMLAACAMFLFSATYHALPHESAWRPLFWHLDHGAIWLAIAGSLACTQATFFSRRGWARWWRRGTWTLAVVGATLELPVLHLLPHWASPLLYIAIGWMGLPVVVAVWMAGRRDASALCVAGGLCATLGGVMDSLAWPNLLPGLVEGHECMHVATTLGGILWLTPNWLEARRELQLPALDLEPVAEPVLVGVE